MARALLIIDVQNDFTEGGALGVTGGKAVAAGISRLLERHPERYDLVVASRDWHDGTNDNGGHFSSSPDYLDSWPAHCVAGTAGAEYDPGLATNGVDVHIRKGQGRPAYSIFEGTADDGRTLAQVLHDATIAEVDVAGIATDYCVRASALDALAGGARVTVLEDLVAGVAASTSAAALDELRAAGARIAPAG